MELIRKRGTGKTLPDLHFTTKQLYWIIYGRSWCSKYSPNELRETAMTGWWKSHSPGPVRVDGVLQNMETFVKDFNCPLGSKMNPQNKCPSIW